MRQNTAVNGFSGLQQKRDSRMRETLRLTVAMLALLVADQYAKADEGAQTVIYDGKVHRVASAQVQASGLWMSVNDLTAATGFHVKPEGICRDELCFPVPKDRRAEFITTRDKTTLFNLSAFAALIGQQVASDTKNGVWYFGTRGSTHDAYLDTLEAPNFTLPDASGKMHSLSDFRGKKVLIVTWASW
jgi:hypothetical protein